ncbi:hypothetical protein METBIDRAFT_77762 [Metschnikowia bicuspidata var. bicuspidata NRRL YB-4993]|uniref:Uncharacterized protein n=1 Tax=Metschnikowia bicuspidata var. bicuspidata NRRL YB-4993 TaxID=869754 RepID=A0A1A0HEJ4_9ASCO|nr:hypothetical protein METBIDRAFT_77762 [Metschnikowia bicuspidata var. bicuspidata NRRL YB-4993]OBA22322.1 hypothetical protein METBIDRAFT_77762 [Metschnikowia bicuspidata var. bicuspidata NRRL YB-4993]
MLAHSDDSVIVLSDDDSPAPAARAPRPDARARPRQAHWPAARTLRSSGTDGHWDPPQNTPRSRGNGARPVPVGPAAPLPKRARLPGAAPARNAPEHALFVAALDQSDLDRDAGPELQVRGRPGRHGAGAIGPREDRGPRVRGGPAQARQNEVVVISDSEDSGQEGGAGSSGRGLLPGTRPMARLARLGAGASSARDAGPADRFFSYSDDDFAAGEGFNEPSDDEIAILSKEEAERVGTFKKSTFDAPVQPAPGPYTQLPNLYNQPVPVFHAGAAAGDSPLTSHEDRVTHDYFLKFSPAKLHTYAHDLDKQVGRLQEETKAHFDDVRDTRRKILMLTSGQAALRDTYLHHVAETLRLADLLLQRLKKVRHYRAIAESVKNAKLAQHLAPVRLGPRGLAGADPAGYGANVNPYMLRPANGDQAHLEDLFKDLYREEKVEGMAPTPAALSIQLLDHQRRGLFWLMEKERAAQGCILADDMGLGKTVQTLAVMAASPPRDPACRTTLIVGPVSLLRQWAAEIKAKIKPSHAWRVASFHGQDRRRLASFAHLAEHDVVLVSYTTLASEFRQHFQQEMEAAQVTKHQNVLPPRGSGGQTYMSPFYSTDARFFRIVLDEAQYIRNKTSQASKATACLRGRHRMCLTGTPMQNTIEDLYPILRFLQCRPYDEEAKFKQDIAVPLKSTSDNFDDYDRNASMKKLRAVLLAVMLRRTKDSKVDGKPLVQLPEKTVTPVYVKMENEELEYYNALEKGIQKKARKLMVSSDGQGHSSFLTLLLRLRQACIHQFLVEVGELNAQENSESFHGTNWEQMYNRALTMSENVHKVLRDLTKKETDLTLNGLPQDERKELQHTCPMCLDVVGDDSIVILANCGHMICDGCASTLFILNGMIQEAPVCASCETFTSTTDIVDYTMYDKIFNMNYDFPKLQHICPTQRKFLIQRDQGFALSAKMEKTLDIIKEITDNTLDEKIIVFSHFTVTFDLMGHALKQDNIKYLRYDGSMNIDDKNNTINEFYQGAPRVLLISLKAGNVGLTLTCASHVVIMDPFWNPYVEDQAMDRAHRFGQERSVKVYRLLIRNSVEDRIMDLQERKKELIGSALDENALKSSSHLGRRELGYLFGLNSLQ